MKKLSVLLLLTLVVESTPSYASTIWNLPAVLSEKNTTVQFEVDTTWHTVEGTAKKVVGNASLADTKDFNSIRIDMILPVSDLDTDSKSRDETMRESMAAEKFPDIHFALTSVTSLCNPDSMVLNKPCFFTAKGDITIRDVTKSVDIAAEAIRTPESAFVITGKSGLNWRDFGVEDPSILVAKVHAPVSIQFKLNLEPDKK